MTRHGSPPQNNRQSDWAINLIAAFARQPSEFPLWLGAMWDCVGAPSASALPNALEAPLPWIVRYPAWEQRAVATALFASRALRAACLPFPACYSFPCSAEVGPAEVGWTEAVSSGSWESKSDSSVGSPLSAPARAL